MNEAPTLDGFDPSLTLAENLVNGAPQLLDADVVFNDAEGNFDGGRLILSGLLAEDRIGIFNQGVLAGQIGTSGTNVTYSGVTIGTFSGGIGSAFNIVFNASATSAAIDTLIQNLTFADVSDAPTATRTLRLDVIDAADAHITPHFAALTGAANPFVAFISSGDSAPAFADLDNDGLPDAVVGQFGGNLRVYHNNGNGTFTQRTGGANPFNGVTGDYLAPAFADLDGDGWLDAVVGGKYGGLRAFHNNHNGTFTELIGSANPFDGVRVDHNGTASYFSKPGFVDLDGDGWLDAVVGESYGQLLAFHNNHNGTFTRLTGTANPFNGVDVGDRSAPSFTDLDGDGKLDAVVGEANGTMLAFHNNGNGTFTQLTGTANPFNGIDVGDRAAPAFADLDGDGKPDALVGDFAGTLLAFHNYLPLSAPFTALTGAANPFDAFASSGDSAPVFVDLDNDGLPDAVVGQFTGSLRVYHNEGDGTFTQRTGGANPFNGVTGDYLAPAFADLDGDGWLDAVVGGKDGTLRAFHNNHNGTFAALTGTANPFDGVRVDNDGAASYFAKPGFVDLDGDGWLDAVVGENYGHLLAFHNNGNGTFTRLTGTANPFNGVDVGDRSAPSFVDLDGDGKLDAVVGAANGTMLAFHNKGDGTFTQLTGTANPFNGIDVGDRAAPTFVDLNRDGKLDALVGDFAGTLLAFRDNVPLVPAITVHVTAQDEAPTLGGVAANAAYVENDPALVLSAGLTVGDVDDTDLESATVQLTGGLAPDDSLSVNGLESGSAGGIVWSYDPLSGTLSFTGVAPIADYQALLRQVSFESASDDPGVGRVVSWTVQGDDGASTVQTTDIAVIAVNDAPFIDLDSTDGPASGTTATYAEGQSPVTIAPFAIVGDVDQPADYDGYVVTAEFTANWGVDDQLEVLNKGPVHVSGYDISYSGIVVATFAGGDNGTPLVISFNSDACGCSLEAITAAIGYSNVSDHPSTLDRSVTFTVDDGAHTDATASAVAIVSVIGNDPPVLTDLATSVTFAEHLVNAGPQLLDADVTFTDPDGNFDGATLTVTGILLEDEIGVRDVGTGPGEISVSGGDISYGGTLIGSLCGCIGDSVTILFNADATAGSIEAVIENLTYANHSDSPTTSRTLIVNVTDSLGADLGAIAGGPAHFNALDGAANPFDGVAVYGLAAPVFVDLDGDGDLDAVVGDASGKLRVLDNDHGTFVPLADVDNPLDGLVLDYAAKPAFMDIDGDGDLDLVVGGAAGGLQLFENDLGSFTELTGTDNPFDAILVDHFAAPVFVDLDGDGKLDLVVGDGYGSVHAFHNEGSGTFTELTGADNPFEAILVDYNGAPVFVDLDGDGDLDLVVGDSYGSLSAFQNDGGVFTELVGTANPFNAILAYGYASPTFVDIDGDGDLDLVVGEALGTIATFENGPAHGLPIVVNVTPENDAPLLDLDVTTPASFTEGDPPLTIAPGAIFADPDQPDNYGGYVVTVDISQNGEAADALTIANIGPGASEIEVSGSDILYEGVVVGSFTGGANGDPLVITFNNVACACSVELTLANILFSNASEDPSELTRTISFTLDDGAGGSASADALVTVTAVEDAAVAHDDAVSTPEDAAIIGANLFGNDGDVDGPPLQIALVNGAAPDFGHAITLTSGAKLTIRADGTFDYDPNGKFGTLTSTSSGEIGAVNVSATDSFTYTLAGGNVATVTVTVNGVANAADHLEGDSGPNVIWGTPNHDYFDLSQGGDDTAFGLGSNDGFFLGAAFTAADRIDGGGGTNDQLALLGDYTGASKLVLDADTMVNIEALVVLPGHSYDITMNDGNVASGERLIVQATQLNPGESLSFNGAAETNGSFLIFGSNGDDHLTGGARNDGFYFGPGQFTGDDIVNGGGGTNDQLGLDGNYGSAGTPFVLDGNITNVEMVVFLPGPLSSLNHFNVTTSDAFVPNGQTMTIYAVEVTTDLTFDGSHEGSSAFTIYGGSGNDVLTGGGGTDWIFGGDGADNLTGGAGNDVFYYDSASQSAPAGDDRIEDFASGDIIDLSHVDAIAGGARDVFTFIGGNAFGGHAGELQAINTAGNSWLVSADTDGDGDADFQLTVIVADHHPLTTADFTF